MWTWSTTKWDYRYAGFDSSECSGSDACLPGALTRQVTRLSGGDELRDVRYGYDAMGNVERRAREGGATETFAYDGFSRLAAYAKNFANGDQETEAYTYSAGGDILSVLTQMPGQDPFHRVYGYDHHRVTSVGGETYHYDANGNQDIRSLIRQDPTSGLFAFITQNLEYNDFNMPWRITVDSAALEGEVLLDYDAGRRRVAKRGVVETTLYAGDLYECTAATPAAGSPIACDDHRFKVYAGGSLVAQVVQDGDGEEQLNQRRYVHSDHLGSSTLLTDVDAVAVEARDFSPFGDTRTNFAETSVRSGFTGHEQDADLGLVNMRGRLYDPGLRRFITPDPFVAAPLDPQGRNRCSYVQNNPLTFVDPRGYSGLPPSAEAEIRRRQEEAARQAAEQAQNEADAEARRIAEAEAYDARDVEPPADAPATTDTIPSEPPPPSPGTSPPPPPNDRSPDKPKPPGSPPSPHGRDGPQQPQCPRSVCLGPGSGGPPPGLNPMLHVGGSNSAPSAYRQPALGQASDAPNPTPAPQPEPSFRDQLQDAMQNESSQWKVAAGVFAAWAGWQAIVHGVPIIVGGASATVGVPGVGQVVGPGAVTIGIVEVSLGLHLLELGVNAVAEGTGELMGARQP